MHATVFMILHFMQYVILLVYLFAINSSIP